MKKIGIFLCVLMAVVPAFAGPIKGLVDVATGMEVPDADLRYVMIDSSGLTTNDSPTMEIGRVHV